VSAFASTSNDFLVKPFAVERFEAALDLATSTIAHLRTEFAAEEQSLALYTPWLLKPLPYPNETESFGRHRHQQYIASMKKQ
jgi:hypothetical protein